MTRCMQQAAAADLSRRLQLLLAFFGVPCGTAGRVDQVLRPDPAHAPQRSNGGRRSTPEGQEPSLDLTGMTSSTTGAAGPPAWRPQPGEVLVGVIDRYAISHMPQGAVRTVIVTEEPTGERVSLRLSSRILLSLFAQHQPHPGERIGVRYRWRDLDNGY